MKTDEVEKILKKKQDPKKSLQEQCTPEQWAEICFISAVEVDIETQKGMVKRTGTDEEIEAAAWAKWQKVLDDCGGDHREALNYFG